MMEKARTLPADAILLDLEDSVPPAEKERARELVRQVLPGFALAGQAVLVRVNSLSSGLLPADLEAVLTPQVTGISLPKVDSPQEIATVDALLGERERALGLAPGATGLFVWIETPRAMVRAYELASASKRIKAVLFGADDFTREMGIPRSRTGEELSFARWTVSLAARAAGVLAIDTPYPDYQDKQGLIQDAQQARRMGYQGKFLIHPSQVEPVNQVFLPSPEEIEEARQVVEAFEAALAQGYATASLKGTMIDTAIAERARRLIAWAKAASSKGAS
jgi:citrate lyase subunit beta/citryl-CoA lyase